MNTNMKIMMHTTSCNCAACVPVPALGIEMPYDIKENCLAVACPKVAAMLSEKDKHFAFEVTVGSRREFTFVCPDCGQEFKARIYSIVKTVKNSSTGCPVCAGRKVIQGINDLASQCPRVATMLSEKDKHFAFEVAAGSRRKLTFVCPDCKQKFKAAVYSVVRSVDKGFTGCSVCAGRKIVPGINDLASQCPEAAAMWSDKNKLSAAEVTVKSSRKAFFKCCNCEQEFEVAVCDVVRSVNNGNTGCPVCAGKRIVPGVNDLATKCPKAAAIWSGENKLSASEITAGSGEKAIFKCPDCGREYEATICDVVYSVNNGSTGCYDCSRKRVISKPECFLVRPMLAFAGENGIANPFTDVRNILGENSLLGLDFVDHIQKFCAEYNGKHFHEFAVEKDRFKFEAARKAGYTMIRIQEPGLEVLEPKYDIVMPEGFYHNGKYDAEIMEEVGRKVIHLLEEIYGRKASPEIWALNNFKEFEVWYDANKKELEANARKKGSKSKTAAKKAA